MKIAIISAVLVLAALVGFTWWALESGGVAVIETQAADGSQRETHVWFAEPDGELWLEAGTPANAWYVDVQADPRVGFSADGRTGAYMARPVAEPEGHDRIRSLLREKYGVRDWWIALIFDTSSSVAVRLVATE